MVHFDNDTRHLITDTSKFPHSAIARIRMKFDDLKTWVGTGFLTDGYIFITAAHNIRDDNNKNARSLEIRFGLNGDSNWSKEKVFKLEGKDFNIPQSYKKMNGIHPCDIAWINMKQYFDQKTAQGSELGWSISDLPEKTFTKYKTPVSHGVIEGNFSLCGNWLEI